MATGAAVERKNGNIVMTIWVGSPAKCAANDVTAAATLIKTGGAIDAKLAVLEGRLRRSRTLAFCQKEGQVVGVGCLKNPVPNYRERVFTKAGVSMDRFQDAPELGYVTVDETMRGQGLAHQLVEALVKILEEPCYATTDDDTMKRMLGRSGFLKLGTEWTGQRGTLSLWTTP